MPASVSLFYYINDNILTLEFLTDLETALEAILDALRDREWKVNPKKDTGAEGPSVAVQLLSYLIGEDTKPTQSYQ